MDRSAVKRYQADRYLFIFLITFVLTVIALRVVLWAAGYPQLGEDVLHVAHVFWGGLALFTASVVLLALANRWALTVGAILSGGGVGLFMDEVGKFVTRSNDYFSPAAAPIIYALFLLTVSIYSYVRRPPEQTARGEMYRAFEQMGHVLDGTITRPDLEALARRLRVVRATTKDGAIVELAASMLNVVQKASAMAPAKPSAWRRWASTLGEGLKRLVFTPRRLQLTLVALLIASGVYQLLNGALAPLRDGSSQSLASGLGLGSLLEIGVGLSSFAGGVLIASGHHERGLSLAIGSLAVGLTFAALFVLYEDQVKGLFITLVQWIALIVALSFKRAYTALGESAEDQPAAYQGLDLLSQEPD